MNFGDIAAAQVLYFHFTTRQFSTGTPITASSLAVSVYKDDGTTESTSGVATTFSGGFDGRAGLVSVKIDTSTDGTFYAAGHDFSVVVTGGTADSVSIVGEVVGYFSIQNRSALRPTTAGRTLDVAATGEAGLDFDNIHDATGAHTLTNITVPLVTTTTTATTASNLTTNNDKTGYTLTQTFPSNFSSLAIDSSGRVNAFLIGILTSVFTEGAVGRIAAAFKQFFNIATPAATMDHLILLDTVSTAAALTTNNDKTGYALTAAYDPAKTAAQAGNAMTLTAAYDAAKTALQSGGSVVATNMRGTDNALLASNYTTPDNSSVTAIKTQTDKLAFTVTNQVDANIQSINDTTITGNGQPGTEFGV